MPELLEGECRPQQQVAIIFNPASGNADPGTRRGKLEELAQAAGLTCDLTETDREKGAAPLAQEAVNDGMERVLVSGGDGSMAEAAGALAGTDSALAVIPGGTGNLLAVNLGLPTDPKEAMDLALNGEAKPTDVGRANGQVFLIMAGMGADARMIREADREMKNRLGPLAYFLTAFRNLGRTRVTYRVTIDGRRFRRRAHTVLVANLGRVTGGVELVPNTGPDNGMLEVAILRARGFWGLAQVAVNAMLGRTRSDNLFEIHHGREVLIRTARPQPVQLDGNDAGATTRLEVHVEPGALRVVRPAEGAANTHALVPQIAEEATRRWAPLVLGLGTVAVGAYLVWRRRSGRGSGGAGQENA
jgi:YegS/Rv2252/BmrU family lipid kinase